MDCFHYRNHLHVRACAQLGRTNNFLYILGAHIHCIYILCQETQSNMAQCILCVFCTSGSLEVVEIKKNMEVVGSCSVCDTEPVPWVSPDKRCYKCFKRENPTACIKTIVKDMIQAELAAQGYSEDLGICDMMSSFYYAKDLTYRPKLYVEKMAPFFYFANYKR